MEEMNKKVLNMKIKFISIVAMLASSLYASNSFGGIGLAISQEQNGARIVSVIPGTPAAATRMQSGDVIIAVDGVPLQGKTIEEMKAKLRGQKNKPLEVTFVNGEDTLSTTLRRTQITVKNLDGEVVKSWYDNKSEYNAQEIETFASATENNKQLVAVLQNGSVVKSDVSISAETLNGIYVERADEFASKTMPPETNNASSARLKMLSRSKVAFELKSSGKVVISIADHDGRIVARLVRANAPAGYNSLNWNSENVPSDRYTVTIEHNGSISGNNVLLK